MKNEIRARLATLAKEAVRAANAAEREFYAAAGYFLLHEDYGFAEMAEPQPVEQPRAEPTDAEMDNLISTVMEIFAERRALLDRLRAALEANRSHEALQLAHEYCSVVQKGGPRERSQKTVH